MRDRLAYCQEQDGGVCSVPLVFTMSPHLTHLAPDWLHWYYNMANMSGPDVFALPPSGHTYSYPGQMDDTNQLSYRDSTNEDCDLLLATGTVHWEWFYGWHAAFAHYFPKYLQTSDSCIQAFFATNVPYNFPTDVVWGDFYQALELVAKQKQAACIL